MYAGDDFGGAPQSFLNADARGATAPSGKPSYTAAKAGDTIIGGEPGWSSALGVPATVTYGFRANAPGTMPSETSGFSRFNSAQITRLSWRSPAGPTSPTSLS